MPTFTSAEDGSGSDISSFAAWEALHPSQSLDENRDRHTDMERIWDDRDSSNDERSSEEDMAEKDSFGFPTLKGTRNKMVGLKERGRLMKMEIPSSDVGSEQEDGPPSSQPRLESEDESAEEEEEPAVKENNIKGFKAGEVIEISSDEEEESEEESDAEAQVEIEKDSGSQAGSQELGGEVGEWEKRENQQDDDSEDESSVEDQIEGFDIKPEDKEFFKDLLQAAPPEAVNELTGKNRRNTSQSSSDTSPAPKEFALEDLAPDAQRLERVKLFAEDHLFRNKENWTEEELEEYEDDVYIFAKATGFSHGQAGLEVMKAVGLWKTERGIALSSSPLIKAASDKLSANAGRLSEEAKKKRKAEKKARRKAMSLARAQSSRATSTAISETRHQNPQHLLPIGHPKLQASQSYYVAEAATAPAASSSDDQVLSAADEKSISLVLKRKLEKKAEKKRKRLAKLGPKKSEYFPASVGAAPMSRQERKKQIKEAKKLLAKKETDEDGNHQARIKQMAREAKQAVEKAPVLVKETPAKKKKQNIPAPATVQPELAGKEKKTRKHNKNRNKNRIPEEQNIITYASIGMDAGTVNASVLKKRAHDGLPKSDAAQESENGRRPVLSSIKNIPASNSLSESIETGETASQRKRKKRKAKALEANNESTEVGSPTNISTLAELTNSQKLHEDRPNYSKRRAMSADASGSDRRSSAQSSKVHHSQ